MPARMLRRGSNQPTHSYRFSRQRRSLGRSGQQKCRRRQSGSVHFAWDRAPRIQAVPPHLRRFHQLAATEHSVSQAYCRKLMNRISDAPSSFFAAATPLSLGFISSFPPSPPEAPIGFVSSDSLAAGYRPVPVSPFPPSPRHNAPNAQIGFVSSFSLRPNNRQPHILA